LDYINLRYFNQYIYNRVITKRNSLTKEERMNEIEKYFLDVRSSQNSLMKSPISSLWWSIELTVDPDNQKDKYYYSKIFLAERNTRVKNLGTYNFIRHKNILFSVLKFYNENKDNLDSNKSRIGSDGIIQQTAKIVNQIGGLTLLSLHNKDEIYELLNTYKYTIQNRATKSRQVRLENKKNKIKESELLLNLNTLKNTLFFLNIAQNGEYEVSKSSLNEFPFSLEIREDDKYLLVNLNSSGYTFKVPIKLLSKKNGNLFTNSIFGKEFLFISNIASINDQSDAIVFLIKKDNRVYFKAQKILNIPLIGASNQLSDYRYIRVYYEEIDFLILNNVDSQLFNGLIKNSTLANFNKLDQQSFPEVYNFLKRKKIVFFN